MRPKQMTYEKRVESLIEQWNSLIDELRETSRCVGPQREQHCDEAIRLLIASREAVRRGLIQVDPFEEVREDLGSESPDQSEKQIGHQPGAIEKVLSRGLDVTRSPKQWYGPEE